MTSWIGRSRRVRDVIGVNNRNLRTLEVDLEASDRLAARMPAHVVAVAESGLRSREDVDRLAARGYRAFLVGERLMTAADPGAALGSADRPGSVRVIVKICGITRPQDAERAVALGATAIGFIFWPSSPRRVRTRGRPVDRSAGAGVRVESRRLRRRAGRGTGAHRG